MDLCGLLSIRVEGTDVILSFIEKHARKEYVSCLVFHGYRSYVTWIETTLAYFMNSLSCACLGQARSKLGGF